MGRRGRSWRLRSHPAQQHEPLRPRVADRVLVARGRAREVAGTDLALLAPDADASGAGEHVVELVADGVAVARLLLPRLEAGPGAEEARRIDPAGPLHLFGGEGEQRGDVAG